MTNFIFRDNSRFEMLSIFLTSFPPYLYVFGEENAFITHLFILLQRIRLALLRPCLEMSSSLDVHAAYLLLLL